MLLDRCTLAVKAVGDPTRARILSLLSGGDEICVCQVMAVLDLPQSTASQQLGILRNAGLITGHRRGRWVFYHLTPGGGDDHVGRLVSLMVEWLGDDLTIRADREWWQKLRQIPFDRLCSQNARKILSRSDLEEKDREGDVHERNVRCRTPGSHGTSSGIL